MSCKAHDNYTTYPLSHCNIYSTTLLGKLFIVLALAVAIGSLNKVSAGSVSVSGLSDKQQNGRQQTSKNIYCTVR